MINLLIPIAGLARRFTEQGYLVPKPLIMVNGQHMIELALTSIKCSAPCRYIFLVLRQHIQNYSIDQVLTKLYPGCEIVTVDHVTRGTLETCLLAKNLIDNDDPLYIFTPDIVFEESYDLNAPWLETHDGFLLTFKANDPSHSYTQIASGDVVKVAEKQVISDQANVGLYGFWRGSVFVAYAESMIAKGHLSNGEFYVAPVYNLMIQDGLSATTSEAVRVYVLGTPEDLNFYTRNIAKKFGERPVGLCSDHSGYQLKEIAKRVLDKAGIKYIDFGCFSQRDCDYNDFIEPVVQNIKDGFIDFAMAFCRSGNGVGMAANRHKHVRAAYVFDDYTAEYAIRHNCANMFAVPSNYVNEEMLTSIVGQLRQAKPDGGRHSNRIMKFDKHD